MQMITAGAKRGLDVIGAGMGLISLSPLIACIALLVRIRLGSPTLFHQSRIGRDGEVFAITKFRTMTDAVDENGDLLSDEVRLTALGSKLRSLSLDELPELFDVLRGTMSLVGPRPLPVRYRDRYNPTQWRRHEVKPGITGWAQVNGRNALSWPEKFAHDIWYVDNHSIWLDVRILARTLVGVATRRGISADEAATMPEFLGTHEDSGN